MLGLCCWFRPDRIMDAIYKLRSPKEQIESYVADVVRAQVCDGNSNSNTRAGPASGSFQPRRAAVLPAARASAGCRCAPRPAYPRPTGASARAPPLDPGKAASLARCTCTPL